MEAAYFAFFFPSFHQKKRSNGGKLAALISVKFFFILWDSDTPLVIVHYFHWSLLPIKMDTVKNLKEINCV